MKFSIKSLTQVLAFACIIEATVGAENNGCGLRVGERDNKDVRHRRMVSVNLPKNRCANSEVVTIDIPHNNIKRSFKKNAMSNAGRVRNAKDPDYWYGEDSSDGSTFNYVQDEDGNIAGSMVDVTNDTVMQFHIENDEPTVIITKSTDFPPEFDPEDAQDVGNMDDRRMLMTDTSDLSEEDAEEMLKAAASEESALNNLRGCASISNVSNTESRSLYDDNGGNLDVMVVWTRDAECRNSGLAKGCSVTSTTGAAMQARVNLAVQETNTAYALSGVNTRLLLVHSYRHPTYNGSSFSGALSDIKNGNVAGVHANRQTYGADIVAMLADLPSYCGIGYLGPSKDWMYSVTNWNCATGYFSFGHEVGHNLGLNHDRGTKNACSNSNYNYGYRDPAARFRSILAYNCVSGQCDNNSGGGCTRVQRFSNPTYGYNGYPIGTATANNARRINDVRVTVARYYTHVSSPPTGGTIKYGNKIHLQNNWMNNRWLTGSRGSGNAQAITRDKLASSYERVTVARTYEWIVRSTAGNGSRTYTDPKNGQCVQVLDNIHLQNNWMDKRWLTGSRGSGNAQAITRDKLASYYERVTVARTYEWFVRLDAGTGSRP